MLDIVLSNRFRRDIRLAVKKGYNLDLMDKVVDKLSRQESLPPKNMELLSFFVPSFSGFLCYSEAYIPPLIRTVISVYPFIPLLRR